MICEDTRRPTGTERLAASIGAAVAGQAIANPADVLKVRLMADGRRVNEGLPPKYTGMTNAAYRIYMEEGIKGFYKGTVAAIQRSALSSGGSLAMYAQTKAWLTDPNGHFRLDNGIVTSTITTLSSALVSTLISAPADVVKTRLMNQDGASKMQYTGFIDCLVKTVKAEGPSSLFKGMVPNFTRILPWQVVFFATYEQISERVTGDTL